MSKVENSKTLFLDFEFSRVVERDVNLVSCVTFDGNETKKFWLHNNNFNQDLLKEYLQKFDRFVAYSAIAECRCFLTLGLDPLKYKWIDLFLEYRCLSNHSDELNYGEQLVEGKVKKVSKPRAKWEKSDSDEAGFKPTHSLAEATFKLLGVIRDTEHKTAMRNLIISDPEKFSDDEMLAILDYGVDDVKDLLPMYKVMKDKYLKRDLRLTGNKLIFEMQLRGRYSAHTAIMERNGYPIDVRKTKNFSNSVGAIMYDCQKEINSLFPKIQPFKWDRKLQKFKWDQKATRAWIRTLDKKILERWRMTDGGKKEKPDLSLAMEAFTDFFDFKHDYPKDNFGAQMVRFLKLKQNLFGFVSSPDKKRKSFWDYVGSDGMVRPYMNIYGAQTSRTQPASTGFMFLKPAWMRALVVPPKGKAMAGIDFGSQEFLLSALLSNDLEMIEAYMSGDPYLAFGKLRGVIPQDGTKASHKIEREMCKSSVLGISYAMTKYGLAIKMTADTGKICTEDEAQEWINEFYNAFPDLAEYKKDIEDSYEEDRFLKLPCVAEGTRIFTEKGFLKIEDILDEKVWDGCKFVEHGGVIVKGKKPVMNLKGTNISATPDHLFLSKNCWMTALEWEGKNSQSQNTEQFLEDGRLLAPYQKSETTELSFAAAYVALKNRLESDHSMMEKLRPVLTALSPCDLGNQSLTDILISFLTNTLLGNGSTAITMPDIGAKIRRMPNTNTTVLEGSNFASNPLEISWNTLVHCLAEIGGMGHSTVSITTDTMSPETYELLVKKKIIKTKNVYDVLNCGPRNRFQAEGLISHNCGWYLFGDNENPRSVGNFPIQGIAGSIMRKAVDIAVENGVQVVKTLHDAIYIIYDIGDEKQIIKLRDAMIEAMGFYFTGRLKEMAMKIKLDPFAWSPDYSEGEMSVEGWKVPTSPLYIDERAIGEYKQFSKYFEDSDADLL